MEPKGMAVVLEKFVQRFEILCGANGKIKEADREQIDAVREIIRDLEGNLPPVATNTVRQGMTMRSPLGALGSALKGTVDTSAAEEKCPTKAGK